MASVRGISAGILAGGGLGAGAYAAAEYNQGGILNQAQAVGAGAGALALGIGATRVALSKKSGTSSRKKAEILMERAASKGSFRTKAALGMMGVSAGLGGKAAYEFSQGDYANTAMYGAGSGVAMAAGFTTFNSGRYYSKKAKTMGDLLDRADTLAGKAARMTSMRRFGIGGLAVGGLAVSAGIYQQDPGTMAVGGGMMAAGGLLASVGGARAARHTRGSEKAIKKATKIGRTSREKDILMGREKPDIGGIYDKKVMPPVRRGMGGGTPGPPPVAIRGNRQLRRYADLSKKIGTTAAAEEISKSVTRLRGPGRGASFLDAAFKAFRSIGP